MYKEMGEMTVSGFDEGGRYFTATRPVWACGHCSRQTEVHPNGIGRPTDACVYCMRWICTAPICHQQCTPLYAMAEDKFERTGEWSKLVPAIMSGALSEEDAVRSGIVDANGRPIQAGQPDKD